MTITSKVGVALTTLAIIVVTGVPALAVSSNSQRANAQEQTASQKKKIVKSKLNEAKQKVCMQRESNINAILSRIADRGQKQLDLFSAIAEKTQKFYELKGRNVANYESLVADVEAKKLSALNTVEAIKSQSVTFKCDGSDPKGVASTFKESLKAEIEALKAYKTSVKNLIVGVKSAQSDAADTTKPSPSPQATVTPTTEANNAQ